MREKEEPAEQYLPGPELENQLDLDHLCEEKRMEVVQHHISLKDSKPLRQPIYRVLERLLPVLKKELEVIREMGVIEPSSSEWSSPIILVQKKDSTLRFCLDFRKVNGVSKVDFYSNAKNR